MSKRRAKRSGGLSFSSGIKEKALIVPSKGFAAIETKGGGFGSKTKGKNKALKTLMS